MNTILKISDLSVRFPIMDRGLFPRVKGHVEAVSGINLEIRKGETLGLVGESGSGKTTLGRAILRGMSHVEGRVEMTVDGKRTDLLALPPRAMRGFRRNLQMIFQDPYASLNPRMTVRDIIAEPLIAQKIVTGRKQLDERILDIALKCGLNREQLGRYPHAFSGGQRQRIAIARALVLHPAIVVCDEPTSALDVSIQAQILNLLSELQSELELTYLLISHDLTAVAYACDRVAVMYLGRIVEIGPVREVYRTPRHPYTETLISTVPEPDPDVPMRPALAEGERPDPANLPKGCAFQSRCASASDVCRRVRPPLTDTGNGHAVACHHPLATVAATVKALTVNDHGLVETFAE